MVTAADHPRAADGMSGRFSRQLLLDLPLVAPVMAISAYALYGFMPNAGRPWLLMVLAGALPALLLLRNQRPALVLWLLTIAILLLAILGYANYGLLGANAVAAFTVGSRLKFHQALPHLAAALVVVVLWSGAIAWPNLVAPDPTLVLTNFLVISVPGILGMIEHQHHREYLRQAYVAWHASQDLQLMTEAAVDAERIRIARELHDVVAHEMTVIALQAEGAKRVGSLPQPVADVLGAIATSSRAALHELTQVLKVLRNVHEDPDDKLNPIPDFSALPGLVEQTRRAGLPVEFEPVPFRVERGAEIAAYRIVQEALTNALKHAGPNATATVSVQYVAAERPELRVQVTDDGRGAIGSYTDHLVNHGLRGMRERVSAFDGHFSAGPRRGGGFQVSAQLPLSQPPTPLSTPTEQAGTSND